MPKLELIFSSEEVNQYFDYLYIYETRYTSVWNNMIRKIRWSKEFSVKEQILSEKIFSTACRWAIRGIPEEVRMDIEMYNLWKKLSSFCMSL